MSACDDDFMPSTGHSHFLSSFLFIPCPRSQSQLVGFLPVFFLGSSPHFPPVLLRLCTRSNTTTPISSKAYYRQTIIVDSPNAAMMPPRSTSICMEPHYLGQRLPTNFFLHSLSFHSSSNGLRSSVNPIIPAFHYLLWTALQRTTVTT